MSEAPTPTPLPIDPLEPELRAALGRGPVVLTAPTGSGKSTQVPRWAARDGRVLVIEPRRVACRGLAARVAELEGTTLGDGVGYSVRDDPRAGPHTRIVFATPGIVLRWLADGPLDDFATVILDEFHERSLDVDLLLALLADRFAGRLAVMSATLDAGRVARHLGGVPLRAEGRAFPVVVHHLPGRAFLPDVRGLEERVAGALDRARNDPGDVLVFLPGKGEIAAVARALTGRDEVDLLPLHGGLTLAEQSRVFAPAARRRVILATNVAETSLTLPGVGVVIDSGLVRRTRYHAGRGFLTRMPIARDSAEQRAGRAGRTAPGVCYRLWSPEALLTETTPPEIHREALDSLVLAAAACGARVEELPFLDPPRDYAVEAAREGLAALGALDRTGRVTARGRTLFGLPLDPPLGNLLVEAERHGSLEDAMDLVAALAAGRSLFRGVPDATGGDLREEGCDAVALIRAVRRGEVARHGLQGPALEEARSIRRRLRQAWGLAGSGPRTPRVDRRRLALTVLGADPRAAHVARRRKRAVAWSNGGTEVQLARESAIDPAAADALVVLETRAVGLDPRKTATLITAAMPVPVAWLVEAGVGEAAVGASEVRDGIVVARLETRYAGRVLAVREEVPRGRLAREALARLFLEGRCFPGARAAAEERLAARGLLRRLLAAGLVPRDVDAALEAEAARPTEDHPAALEPWLLHRLEALGLESGDELPLLGLDDLLPPALPSRAREWLDDAFPRTVDLGEAAYRVDYDVVGRTATLVRVAGHRKTPPSLTFLPPLRGFGIRVRHHSREWQLR